MNSVQENKNELEAAVRYCESAISRAKATIESMEFRQQAASKAWHEQTGREAALEREVTRLKGIIAERNNVIDDAKESRADLLMQIEGHRTNMALMTDELEKLRSEKEASSGTCGCQGYRDLEERNGELKTQLVEWRDRSAGYTKEIGELKVQLGEREDKWDDVMNENRELHRKIQEMEQTMQLQKDQIAMFQRKMSRMNEVSNRSVLDRE